MKKLLLILVLFTIGCKDCVTNLQQYPPDKTVKKEFKEGSLVYVSNESFIVESFNEYDGTYWLKKINCKSSGSGCSYEVLGSEITKTPQIFEQQKTISDEGL